MPKTYQDIITEARELLQDSNDPFRYTDATLLAALNRGLQEMGRVRPDAFWDRYDDTLADILVPEVVIIDADPDDNPDEIDFDEDSQVALEDPVDFPMQFFNPLVYFVIGQAEIRDDEYTDDGRASMMLAQFKQQLVSL